MEKTIEAIEKRFRRIIIAIIGLCFQYLSISYFKEYYPFNHSELSGWARFSELTNDIFIFFLLELIAVYLFLTAIYAFRDN